MKPSVIYYGAGLEARKKFYEWIDDEIPIPVCFADADESKHYTIFSVSDLSSKSIPHFECEIIPLQTALDKYPDYIIYVTVSHVYLLSVTGYLISQGVPRERIKYADPVVYKNGCHFLLTHIFLSAQSVGTCCIKPWSIRIPRKSTVKETYQNYMETFYKIFIDISESKTNSCDGCPCLMTGIWEIKPQIKSLVFNSSFVDSVCNFKCLYCSAMNDGDERVSHGERFIDVFREAVEYFYNTKNLLIQLAVGEVSVSSWRNEVLNTIKNRNWYCLCYTNASVFVDDIAEMMKEGYISLLVSLDAGTRVTYRHIHGVDCFDTVVSNLMQYSLFGQSVCLKYLILPEVNTNHDDIDGFLDIASKTGFEVVIAKANLFNERHNKLPSSAMEMVLSFIKKSFSCKVKLSFHKAFFNEQDVVLVRTTYPELEIV